MIARTPITYCVVLAVVALLAIARAGGAEQDSLPSVGPLSIRPPVVQTQAPGQSAPAAESLPSLQTTPLMFDADTSQPASGNQSEDEGDLVKKTLNPVADLISLPFQYNADFGIGPKSASNSVLNIQPVIPISLNQDWNLISRTILPVIYAGSPANGVSSEWGLGDTSESLFLSPKQTVGGWILGAGPVVLFPTATNDALGSGKWGLGPTAVALRQENGWTYGILANQIWSFAGDGNRRSVNATFLQPFIAYSFPTFTSIVINTESTYDWSRNQWTIPLNLDVTQVLKIGNQPVSMQIGPRYYADRPSGGPTWGLRFNFTLLFPK